MATLLVHYLFNFLQNKLGNRIGFKKIVSSIGWLFIDKLLRLGVGLIVGVWVARYLGPEDYGMLNYSIAFVALFGVLASLGLSNIVVREIVKSPQEAGTLLGSSFILKIIGGLLVVLLSCSGILFVRPNNPLMFYLVIFSASGTVFQAFDAIDFYFQAKVLSKYTVFAKNAAFIIASVVKVFLLVLKASLLTFAIIGLFETLVGSLFMIIAYYHSKQHISHWKPTLNSIRYLLKMSWPLILSDLAIILYMRIDQVMIGKMLGDRFVGVYSAAIKISEIWYFIPTCISISIFPALIKERERGELYYLKRINQIFLFALLFSVPTAIFISIFSNQIVDLLYGNQYFDAGRILAIHIWAGVPLFIGLGYGKMFIIEDRIKITFYLTAFNALLNILLNLLLIPKYGAVGAAAATTLTQFVSFFIGIMCLNNNRRLF
jgi:polysaccharide transporter, PST family